MPIYSTKVPGAGKRPTEQVGLFGVLGEKLTDPTQSKLMRLLDVLTAGQQAAAGLTKEYVRRAEGMPPMPYRKAVVRGMRERASFRDVTGNPLSGFGLDMIVDPINILSFGAVSLPKMGAKALAKMPAVAKTAKFTNRAIQNRDSVRRVEEAIGNIFVRDYQLRKYNPEKIRRIKNKWLGEMQYQAEVLGKNIREEIEALVPDTQMRVKIFDLLEQRPIGKFDPTDVQAVGFFSDFNKLADVEKVAFRRAAHWLDQLERLKIKAGLLTKERAAGFLRAGGMAYVPHRVARKSYVLDRLEEIKAFPSMAKEAGLDISKVDELIETFRKTPEVIDSGMLERIKNMYKNKLLPSSTKVRKHKRPGKEILEEEIFNIELDIAKALQIESAQVAKAITSQHYVKHLVDWLDESGLIVPAKIADDPKQLKPFLTKVIGEEEAVRRARDTYVTVSGVKSLAGRALPKSIANEITSAIKFYSDPESLKNTFSLWRQATNFFKAWTLAPFPSFHARNFISNIWNSSYAGVTGLDAVEDYKNAFVFVSKWKKKRFTGDKVFKGMTDKQFYEEALKHRVIRAGEIMGEIGDAVEDAASPTSIMWRGINPRTSPIIKKGFEFGTLIEDSSRLAHFMNKIKKGASLEDAAASVQKYLFDYQYGLPAFIQKVGRERLTPFIAWTYFNIPLQLEMLALQPKRLTAVYKAKETVEDIWGGPDPDETMLAEWLKRSPNVRIRYNEKTGKSEHWILDNWWPASDVGALFSRRELGQELLNQLTPFVKTPMESLMNYNLFQHRKIAEFKGQKGKVLGVPLVKRAEHFVRTIRVINELDRAIQIMFPPESTDDSPTRRLGMAILRLGLGKAYPQDHKKQRQWWDIGTSKRLRYLKGKRKGYEKRGDTRNIEAVDKEIKKLEDLRNNHLKL